MTDRDLLQRFARTRDEQAFAALVHRHGPLVLGVCRRVLRQEQDAEDVFQATFLVLARKAGSIGQPDRLGNWLYGVASRVARKARANAVRRESRQQQVTDLPARQSDSPSDGDEMRQFLDEEVARLPDKFRAPLVLCYLQGLTREEAAARLGWSAGAVKGMLERGREVLRSRLARRGVALSAGSFAAMLCGNELPAGLSESAIKVAVVFAAGQSSVPGNAVSLAEGVLNAMHMKRVTVWLAVFLALGLTGAGAALLAHGQKSPEGPAVTKKAETGPKADDRAAQLRKSAEARLDAAKSAYEGYWTRYEAGADREEWVHLWSRRWLQAQLDVSQKKADRDAALAAYQERLRKTDELARTRLLLGNTPLADLSRIEFDPGTRTINTPEAYFEQTWKGYQESSASEEQVCMASLALLLYQHRASKVVKKIDPRAELQAHLDRIRKVEAIAKARSDAGKTTHMQHETAVFHRLNAEEWLAQGKVFEEDDRDVGAPPK